MTAQSPILRPRLRSVLAAVLAAALAACASMPPPHVQRRGDLSHAPQAGANGTQAAARTVVVTGSNGVKAEVLPAEEGAEAGTRPLIRRGTGQVINRSAASAPPPNLGATSGAATFNFEGESLQAVVKAILGDMLGQNYVIAPGVQGTVTLATPKPVSPASAMSLLEMVLGWNNARMVYSDGRYNIVPADQALAGTVAPRTGSPESARGFEVRAVPLRYISATEMEKILKPYARPNAIVNVDSGRNLITLSGTRNELENYLRTVQVFDVDWMSSMSVGVFPLQTGKATQVVSDLEKVFGEQSKSPVAGMFRFMPLEAANAVMVITPQANYLDDIQQWLERIDGAGAGVQLFSYELKYIKAADLAARLSEAFGGRSASTQAPTGNPSMMPGTNPTEIKDSGVDDNSDLSSATIGNGTGADAGSGAGGDLGSGSLSLNQPGQGNAAATLEVGGEKVGVSAVDETNTLLVRSSGQAWRSIKEVIEKLDVMPLQVHIEAQIAQVTLTGDLNYGVNWYFQNVIGTRTLPTGVRPLQTKGRRETVSIPTDVKAEKLLFLCHGYFMGGSISADIKRIIFVDPKQYEAVPNQQKYDIARAIGALNKQISNKDDTGLLMLGPGRWGTTTPSLGVPVSFSEINNVTVLGELACEGTNLVPDLSFGTHFFQDLVETDIFYVAIFPSQKGFAFNEKWFAAQPNQLAAPLPDKAKYADVIKVIDLANSPARIVGDVISQQVMCFLP